MMYKTKPKEILIDFFINNKEKSYSGNELVNIFENKIDKSTIYRRLNKLENNKTLRKTYNATKKAYEYQYSNVCESHLHLSCSKCGKIIHLNCGLANDFLVQFMNEHSFNIDSFNSTIYGVCKECE